jgi:hypothetical protein
VLLLICLIAMAWLGWSYLQRRAQYAQIESLGGELHATWQGPSWLETPLRDRRLPIFDQVTAMRWPPPDSTQRDSDQATHPEDDQANFDQLVAMLPQLSWMTNLGLSQSPVDDDDLITVARCQQLESLRLSGTFITDVGLKRLGRLPNLKMLSLDYSIINGEGFVTWEASRLEGLVLSSPCITTRGAECLSRLPHLSSATILCDVFDDAACEKLGESKSVKNLDVYSERITIEGVHHLLKAPRLEYLHVRSDLISSEQGAECIDEYPAVSMTINNSNAEFLRKP